ncbi:MAG: hypothetical protein GY750_08225 [Lentisphaerae bacterium]|nr:hypothetical protein [Lentisphaerota bacterium]MCP4101395.1 hypothetical protein [Lentisphaerota bacterium]
MRQSKFSLPWCFYFLSIAAYCNICSGAISGCKCTNAKSMKKFVMLTLENGKHKESNSKMISAKTSNASRIARQIDAEVANIISRKFINDYLHESSKYIGKWFLFSGTISHVHLSLPDESDIYFEDDCIGISVYMDNTAGEPTRRLILCYAKLSKESADSLGKGEKIMVKGKLSYSSRSHDIIFEWCQIERQEE